MSTEEIQSHIDSIGRDMDNSLKKFRSKRDAFGKYQFKDCEKCINELKEIEEKIIINNSLSIKSSYNDEEDYNNLNSIHYFIAETMAHAILSNKQKSNHSYNREDVQKRFDTYFNKKDFDGLEYRTSSPNYLDCSNKLMIELNKQ